MFKQIPAPSKADLQRALGDDFADRWDHDKVSSWLQERGWGHVAATFRDHNICGEEFFNITLAKLVEILPRPVTTYAERRRLLNDIRNLGTPTIVTDTHRSTVPANISINTNVCYTDNNGSILFDNTTINNNNNNNSRSPSLPSAGTPTSAHPASNSPTTPLSASRCDCHSAAAGTHQMDHHHHHKDSTHFIRNGLSPAPSPSSSEIPPPPMHRTTRQSPTRSYSPKAAFSKIKNSLLNTNASSSSPSLVPSPYTAAPVPVISPRTSSMNYDVAAFNAEVEERLKSAPSRFSATPEKLSKLWSHWRSSGSHRVTKGQLQQITSDENSTNAKKNGLCRPIHKRFSDQRIQVTGDKETWYSIVVTDIRDPDTLKDKILERMQLGGTRDDYYYFHENSPEPEIPLSSRDLVYLCSIADHAATQRILIRPVKDHTLPPFSDSTLSLARQSCIAYTDYRFLRSHERHATSMYWNASCSLSTPELGHSPLDTSLQTTPAMNDGYAFPPAFAHPYRPLSRQSAVTPRHAPPYEPVGIQLSDPPTPQQFEDDAPLGIESDTVKQYRQRIGSEPSVHEPGVESRAWTRRSEPSLQRPITSGLWAVPPRTSCPDLGQCQARCKPVQLWAVPPSTHPLHDAGKQEEEEGDVTPPSSPRQFWGERPPAEVVCQNIDQYFDDHDLDKEIVVDSPAPQPNLRRQHTKSIRVVAREASRKYSRARSKASSSNSGGSGVLRRKSTKLWGQRVIEVKPGREQEQSLQALREQQHSMTLEGEEQQVQWIRGKLIGKGSFGRVYLAFNVATGEVIAVKQVEIPPAKKTTSHRSNHQHQHDMIEALYQEIAMLRDLDHDNIVQYLGYGRDDAEGVVNIFLEYVSGGSIASRLALHGAFEEPLVRHFTRQICLGIEYLHSKNILHRDIKAANILVEADGVCKISDFGLSKKNDYHQVYDQNSRMSLRGSVYWMAPEVVKNEPYSAKVDIWSLGCTVIEMFTGQRPWLTLNQIATLYNLGCQKSPDIPEDISDVAKDFLRLCFLIDPSKRPTASALLSHPFCQPDPSFAFTDYVNKGKV